LPKFVRGSIPRHLIEPLGVDDLPFQECFIGSYERVLSTILSAFVVAKPTNQESKQSVVMTSHEVSQDIPWWRDVLGPFQGTNRFHHYMLTPLFMRVL
jgi:hypothetical protein